MSPDNCLLSICIPTYNRPRELAQTLRVLEAEMRPLGEAGWSCIEVIVSDNASPCEGVREIVAPYAGAPVRATLHVQSTNVGGTMNFEGCYRRARGRHVLLLSDDDHLLPGTLAPVFDCLREADPDIVFLPFDPQPASSEPIERLERNAFLAKVGYFPTLLSASVVRRSLIEPVLGRYLDTNMHHYFYFLTALEQGEKFFHVNRQVLFCPYEDNSGGYNWFRTFGAELPRILREFPRRRIERRAISRVGAHLLKKHIVPTFVNRQIKGYTVNRRFAADTTGAVVRLVARNFARQPAFWLLFLPFALTPPPVLRLLKRVYLWQKSFLFQWHAS